MSQVNLSRIVQLLRDQRDITAYIENTGSGIAVIHVGDIRNDGVAELEAGPGQFTSSLDNDPLGDTSDFTIGPDADEPDADDPALNYTATDQDTEQTLTDHIAEILHIRRHRAGTCDHSKEENL